MSEALARVLVVDDEADLRALLQRYLTDQGCFVLDVMMPGEDGLSICRRLRAQGETIPIVMLTARGDPLDRIIGLEMGADDYLPKPFTPRELLARIQALVRRQRMNSTCCPRRRTACAPACAFHCRRPAELGRASCGAGAPHVRRRMRRPASPYTLACAAGSRARPVPFADELLSGVPR